VNVEIKKTELNPPRELGLRLADAFPGVVNDFVNTVAMRRLRLGIHHSNAYGRPGHAKFVLQFPHCNWRRKDERGQSHKPDLAKIADKKMRRVIQKAVQGTALHPVLETIIRRTTRKIKAQRGDIELAVDDGAVHAGQATREFREAELELRAGSAKGLLLAAEKLLGDHELKLSTRSKAERGYRLVFGKKGANAEPEKARHAWVTRKNSCAEAFSAILESATRQILVNRQAVLETDDPEGAHQLRIGLRRLRGTLRALRPLVDRGCLRAFERSARNLGRSAGMLRDADVMISGIMAPMEAVASDKSGFAELHAALVRDRRDKRDEICAALRSPAWTKLQLYLTLWPPTLEESAARERPITKHPRKVLRKAWKKSAELA
jgi:triphosphatase